MSSAGTDMKETAEVNAENPATGQITQGTTGCMPNFEPACYAIGKSVGNKKPPIYVQVGKNLPIKITYNDDNTIDEATKLSDNNIKDMETDIAKPEANGEGTDDPAGGARRKRRSNKRKPKKSAKKPKRSKKGKTRKQKK